MPWKVFWHKDCPYGPGGNWQWKRSAAGNPIPITWKMPRDSGIKVCRPYWLHHFLKKKRHDLFSSYGKAIVPKTFQGWRTGSPSGGSCIDLGIITNTCNPGHISNCWNRSSVLPMGLRKKIITFLSHLLEERIRYNYPPHTRTGLIPCPETTAGKKLQRLAKCLKQIFRPVPRAHFCPVGTRKIVFALPYSAHYTQKPQCSKRKRQTGRNYQTAFLFSPHNAG